MENGYCINGLRRTALLAMMAFSLLFAAACGNGEETSRCEDNEVWAQDSDLENKCLLKCDEASGGADVCSEGTACDSRSLCTTRPSSGDNSGNGGNTTDNQNAAPNQNSNDSGLSDEDQDLCNHYCYLVYGCITETCSGINEAAVADIVFLCLHGDEEFSGCYDDLQGANADEYRSDYEQVVYGDEDGVIGTTKNTCAATKPIRCGQLGLNSNCNCEEPTTIGDACGSDDACDAGDLAVGLCLPEEEQQGVTVNPGGMCVARACDRLTRGADSDEYASLSYETGCGEGAACVNTAISATQNVGLCFPTCEKVDDCRDGYACQIAGDAWMPNPNPTSVENLYLPVGIGRICDVSCTSDDQCVESGRCNTDTGACEFACSDAEMEGICQELNGECTQIDDKNICVLP